MARVPKNRDSSKFFSTTQENIVAKLLGGETVSGSGAPKFCAGDVLTEDFLIECKTSMKPKESFSLKREWLIKNEIERIGTNKRYGSLAISFSPEGTENYFVINEKLMKKLVNMLREE